MLDSGLCLTLMSERERYLIFSVGSEGVASGGLSLYFRFFVRFFDLPATVGGKPTVILVRLDPGYTMGVFSELKGCMALFRLFSGEGMRLRSPRLDSA